MAEHPGIVHAPVVRAADRPDQWRAFNLNEALFPRFHQWELVTSLLDTARHEGPGHRYLVQHSAGSGKTNSIAWLAHGLSKLHDEHDRKVFDSVVVVTDRTVLDDQLQKAITSLEGTAGTIARINIDEARKTGESLKSAYLAESLLSGKQIVIVTMQTFPFVLDAIAATSGLADRNFAIVADEAHSSQTGRVSQKLRAVLTTTDQADVDDGGEVALEDLIAAEMTARADAANLSFFAFTATPKAKTLERFGRPDEDGVPQAFHVYTMQQAIEEGFILDVLRNYTTYKTAFQVAENTKNPYSEDELVDEFTATATTWPRSSPFQAPSPRSRQLTCHSGMPNRRTRRTRSTGVCADVPCPTHSPPTSTKS